MDYKFLSMELTELLRHINSQINNVKIEAFHMGISASAMRNTNGDWVMSGLLQAKAQTLSSLVLLRKEE